MLVVEDSHLQAKVLEKALTVAGFPVKITRDGVEAWRYLEHTTPDMIVSDILMPAMDGYELCRRIRAERRFDTTPVLLFSNMSAVEDLVAGLQAGADGYLTKPCPPEVLIERLESVLGDTRCEAGPEGELQATAGGRTHLVAVNPRRTLSMLVSAFENAVRQTRMSFPEQD